MKSLGYSVMFSLGLVTELGAAATEPSLATLEKQFRELPLKLVINTPG